MTSAVPAPPEADVRSIREGVELANIPTLVALLGHVTGDPRWTKAPYRPTLPKGLDDNDDGGLPRSEQADIRAAVVDLLVRPRPTLPEVAPEGLASLLSVSMGEPIPVEYGPMMAHDLRAAATASETQPIATHAWKRAVIIGAGVSGIAAAVAFGRAGIDCIVLERNADVGGTWLDNRYPGAGVDTPSHLYEYSFAPHDWRAYFSAQSDVEDYVQQVADRFDVRQRTRFGREALRARFDDLSRSWTVDVVDDSGRREAISADFVVSAVGAFNKPKIPAIAGIEDFDGPAFHTARWSAGDLRDKRVAIIGNGASAMQVVPAIAEDVRSLTIFQRSPHWISPFDKLHREVPDPVRALMRAVPLYHGWYRQRLGWTFNDKVHPTLRRDPSWPHPERSLNPANDRYRKYFTAYLEGQLAGRPDLIAKSLPTYPPFGKRILMDNGWYQALRRDNVQLVTSGVNELGRGSVRTADGESYDADAVVFASGFEVVSFLSTIEVTGRDGRSLHDTWGGDDARAFLGLAVPEFPNFFILYGPNTQPGHGGSLITAVEAQLHYILTAINAAAAAGSDLVEVRQDVFDAYNARVDALHEEMVWTHPGMDTYYRNGRGRVVVNTPFRIVDFWAMTRMDPRRHLTIGQVSG
jgi:4-hydroxyacetophenone monooxygenase